MQVLDVGCGVGGPAREIAKFSGANITGLNNNDYQIDRAIYYAEKEKLSKQLTYVKGDFMVCNLCPASWQCCAKPNESKWWLTEHIANALP